MRKFMFLIASFVMTGMLEMGAMVPEDSEGHVYVALWKEFASAQRADKPETQAQVLSKIKEKALKERVSWDWWDAASRYPNVVASKNWKLREGLIDKLKEEVTVYDEPIVSFTWQMRFSSLQEAVASAMDKKVHLMKSSNPSFWRHNGSVASMMGGSLTKYIRNDFEYALWASVTNDRSSTELSRILADSYPAGAYLQYHMLSHKHPVDEVQRLEQTEALRALEKKWSGTAISMYPRMDLLVRKLDSLQEAKVSSDTYKAFMKELQQFNLDKATLVASEADLVKGLSTKNMIDYLNSKGLQLSVENGRADIFFKNLSSAQLIMECDGRQVFSTLLKNPKQSFFVMDTVRLDLPVADDGEYVIRVKNGKVESESHIDKYTISLAGRRDSRGFGIYVADYVTGEPLEKADLNVMKSGKVILSQKDVALENGFTLLPKSFQSVFDGKDWKTLSASVRDTGGIIRKSGNLTIMGETPGRNESRKESIFVKIMTDRGAYKPGDTLEFKAIVYRGDMVKTPLDVCGEMSVNAVLRDSEGKVIEAKVLKTNKFGSVAGAFPIPRGLRNGMFSLQISPENSKITHSRSVRVDEYVLPTFDLVFDELEDVLLPGDSVKVCGRLQSYTGHNMTSSVLKYKVTEGGRIISEDNLKPGVDGRFEIAFKSSDNDWQHLTVNVIVTDGTGETWEFNKYVFISSRFSVQARLLNGVDADASSGLEWNVRRLPVIESSQALIRLDVMDGNGRRTPIELEYKLRNEQGAVLAEGRTMSGDTLSLNKIRGGIYEIEAEVFLQGRKEMKSSSKLRFVRIDPREMVIDAPVNAYFRAYGQQVENGSQIRADVGSATGPVWGVVEVFGENSRLLESQTFHIEGQRGSDTSVKTLAYAYNADWPDAVAMRVCWFRDGNFYSYTHVWRRIRPTLDLPLKFDSFEDKTLPSTKYTFSLRTIPSVEVLAAVYDKSTEKIASNLWTEVKMHDFTVSAPRILEKCGSYNTFRSHITDYAQFNTKGPLIGYATRAYGSIAKTSINDMAMADDVVVEAETAAPEQSMAPSQVAIRSDFSNTLTFQPFLYSDSEGRVSFSFSTSDKLSTYMVALYAHDRSMRNSTLYGETIVTLPVKISVLEPAYIYDTDKISIAATLSSSSDSEVKGKMSFWLYCDKDCSEESLVSSKTFDVVLPAGESLSRSFELNPKGGVSSEMVMKVIFSGNGFSDGVKLNIPVLTSSQVLTESHSAVLLPGMDKDSLLRQLQCEFVNTSHNGAEYKEISVIDMVRAALPSKVEPESDNVLSLSEAWYVRHFIQQSDCKLSTEELLSRILACRNADGGFGWFEGMPSSPIITAVMLERLSKFACDSIDFKPSVEYLDRSQFGTGRPIWRGGLSDAQYMYVRSIFPQVSFNVKGNGKAFDTRMAEFRKWAGGYLIPRKERGLNGRVLDKARRIKTLRNLCSSGEGIDLAHSWGLKFEVSRKMEASIDADMASLLEYAVEHRDGGIYYPNAVMPWRGLLESEVYAHALLADLISEYGAHINDQKYTKTSDGIRLWLMLQKETQQWGSDPAFVDAINSVMSASEELKATKIVTLGKTYLKPFSVLKEAGNGLRIERSFQRASTGESLKEGDVIEVGEKIIAEYRIWNAENRSFVRVTAPREACMRPVVQLSGRYGHGLRILGTGSGREVSPSSGYREVRADKTVYYFETCPEENSVISEEMFVTNAGCFHAPVVEIESLYAPHYRANSASSPALEVR